MTINFHFMISARSFQENSYFPLGTSQGLDIYAGQAGLEGMATTGRPCPTEGRGRRPPCFPSSFDGNALRWKLAAESESQCLWK